MFNTRFANILHSFGFIPVKVSLGLVSLQFILFSSGRCTMPMDNGGDVAAMC